MAEPPPIRDAMSPEQPKDTATGKGESRLPYGYRLPGYRREWTAVFVPDLNQIWIPP